LKLREVFPGQAIFGRSDVMKVIDLKPSRASDLIKELAEHGDHRAGLRARKKQVSLSTAVGSI